MLIQCIDDSAEEIELGNTMEKADLTPESLEGGIERLRHLAGGMPGAHMTDATR